MSYGITEIEDIILNYLQENYPKSVIAENINLEFVRKIAIRISEEQVENAIKNLKRDKKIAVYHSEKTNQTEIKALGSKLFYDEWLNRENREDYIEKAFEEQSFFLETIEKSLDKTLNQYKKEVRDMEKNFLNKMIQSFGIIAAIFAFIVTVLGYSGGIFEIFNTIIETEILGIWSLIVYLFSLSLALFIPVGIISIILIWFVKK